jgi:hypothetical protein
VREEVAVSGCTFSEEKRQSCSREMLKFELTMAVNVRRSLRVRAESNKCAPKVGMEATDLGGDG